MIKVTSGVNTLELEVVGQSFATVKHQLKTVLNLEGNETAKINGENIVPDYILKDGDEIEFIKASGRKGAVEIASGVNDMSLDVAGKTVGDVRTQLASVLGIDSSHNAEVNGSQVDNNHVLSNGDKLEFVKASGSKGTIQVTAGVNEMSLDIGGKTVTEVRTQMSGILGIDSQYTAKVNDEEVDGDYVLEEGDELEFVKASGSKGIVKVTITVQA